MLNRGGTPSVVHSAVTAAMIRRGVQLKMTAEDCANYEALGQIGIHITPKFMREQARAFGMDDSQPLITTASIPGATQFLQSFLPGVVRILTAGRRADELMGVVTAGSWEDEEVIQELLEPTGNAVLYGDYTGVPLSSWNLVYERRTVVRWEQGFSVSMLEEARSAKVRINSSAEKRNAAALALEIIRNRVGFLGFNGGANRTYGFLNDPGLPAYVTAAATGTGSSTLWSTKTFLNITADIRGMFARLQAASKDNIDVTRTPTVLTTATSVYQYLTVTSDYGMSVIDWLTKTYPQCRLLSAPELDAANGGANVAYLYAEKVEDGGTDGGAVWAQVIPTKFRALGTERTSKGYIEDFSNATAGVFVKRPFAVQRLTGI